MIQIVGVDSEKQHQKKETTIMRINKSKQRMMPETQKNTLKYQQEKQQEIIEEGGQKYLSQEPPLNHYPLAHQNQLLTYHLRQPPFQGSPTSLNYPRTVLAPLMGQSSLEPQDCEVHQLKRVQAKNLFTGLSNKLIDIQTYQNNSPPLSTNRSNNQATPYQIEKLITQETSNQSIRPKANSAWNPEVTGSPWAILNFQEVPGKTAAISPRNIRLKAIDQQLFGSQSRPPSLQVPHSDRSNTHIKSVCPQKKSLEQAQEEEDFKDNNQDYQNNLPSQKINEIIDKKTINNHKKIMIKQKSFKSPQEMNGLIHRPYQSKLIGFAFQKSIPTNVSQSSAKSPGLNLKSNNSTSSCFLESKDDVLTARSTEQTASCQMEYKAKKLIFQDNSCSQILEKSTNISQNSITQQTQYSFREFRACSGSKQKNDKAITRILQNNKINPPLDDVDEEPNVLIENESKLVQKFSKSTRKNLQQQYIDNQQESCKDFQKVLNIHEKIAPFTERQYRILSRNAVITLNKNSNQNKNNSSNSSYQDRATQKYPWTQPQQTSSSSQGDLLRQVTHTLSLNKISCYYGRERKINMDKWKPSSQWDTTTDQDSNNKSKNILNSSKNNEVSGQNTDQIEETPNVVSNSQVVKIGKKMIKIINPYRDRKVIRKDESSGKHAVEQIQLSLCILGDLNSKHQSNNEDAYECSEQLGMNNSKNAQTYIKQEMQYQKDWTIKESKENCQEGQKQIIPEICFTKPREGFGMDNNNNNNNTNYQGSNSQLSIRNKNLFESSQEQTQSQQNKIIIPKEKKIVSARMLADMLSRVQAKDDTYYFPRGQKNGKIKEISKKSDQIPFNNELDIIQMPAQDITGNNLNENLGCSLSSTLQELINLIQQ